MKSATLFLLLIACLGFSCFSYAQKDSTEQWSFHFQQTVVTQNHGAFSAPYSGLKSLSSQEETKTSLTSTLFAGARLWRNGAVFFNPEISGGEGFSNVQGIAGFTNGEIYRVGNPTPAIYIARLFIQQTFNLGNARAMVSPDANRLGGMVDSSRIRILAGKFCLTDLFDNNTYSHDPRTQFLNWSLMSNGAWDYPANMKGYTCGFMAELVMKNYALRIASVLVPSEANGPELDMHISEAHGEAVEFEKPYSIKGKKGVWRIFAFNNLARMGNYRQTLSDTINNDNIANTRKYGRNKYGFGLSMEQYISTTLGLFMRAGWNDGHTETWAYTEIDQTLSVGAVLNGSRWKRPDDRFGIAFVANGISNDHRDYLASGGYGFIIGDGKLLHYGYEYILEIYYSFQLVKTFYISPDYQLVINPAYNMDRGPVNVMGLRAHFEL